MPFVEENPIVLPCKFGFKTSAGGDVANVTGHCAAAVIVAKHLWLRISIHETRHETRGTNPLPVDFAESDYRILRIGMKGIGRILRVGLKTEEFTASLRPGSPCRIGVSVQIERLRCDRKVTKPVKYGTIPVDLHALQDVRMVPKNNIRSSIDGAAANLTFIHAHRSWSVPESLV